MGNECSLCWLSVIKPPNLHSHFISCYIFPNSTETGLPWPGLQMPLAFSVDFSTLPSAHHTPVVKGHLKSHSPSFLCASKIGSRQWGPPLLCPAPAPHAQALGLLTSVCGGSMDATPSWTENEGTGRPVLSLLVSHLTEGLKNRSNVG